MDEKTKLAAFWLLGVAAAFQVRGYPKWLERKSFFAHRKTAHEILGGGTYRGPLPLYDLIEYVERLSNHLTPPLRFTEKQSASA